MSVIWGESKASNPRVLTWSFLIDALLWAAFLAFMWWVPGLDR